MTRQPKRAYVANLGDRNPIEYGGAFVYVDTTGVYAPEMEILEEPCEDNPTGPYTVYRVCLEPHTFTRGILSDNPYHPEHPAWYWYDADKWHKAGLLDVCDSSDIPQSELIGLLCNPDPIKRATGYQYLIGRYGAHEFDGDPLSLTRGEVSRRYRTEIKQAASGLGMVLTEKREDC